MIINPVAGMDSVVPPLLLKLAGVKALDSQLTYRDLEKNKAEMDKVYKIKEKLDSIIPFRLTYLFGQEAVHLQSQETSYLTPLSIDRNLLWVEELGLIDETHPVQFVLYRKEMGFFRSPVLIGYLRSLAWVLEENGKDEVEILFKFPEALITKKFFTSGLEKEFSLKKETITDPYQNELGDWVVLYKVNYEQENFYRFEFTVEP